MRRLLDRFMKWWKGEEPDQIDYDKLRDLVPQRVKREDVDMGGNKYESKWGDNS